MTDAPETEDKVEAEPNGVVRRWLAEINNASKREQKWRREAEKAEDIYSDEEDKVRFNILFSNTQTLAPALYNTTPRPDVRRRFGDADPIGKVVSEVLERCLSYSVDSYDFDATIDACILDYLLTGRCVARVRYRPTYGDAQRDRIPVQESTDVEGNMVYAGPDGIVEDVQYDEAGAFTEGEEYEPVVYEEAVCDHVQWDDFRVLGGARVWKHVTAIAFRHQMTRKEMITEFGEIGSEAPLNAEKTKDEELEDVQKGEIWEVWDKTKRRVLFVMQGFDKPLKVMDDPLELEGFFPIPEPLLSIRKTRSLIPKPEYFIYKQQAEDLNKVSSRISLLTDSIKARGIYNPLLGDNLERMLDNDNDGVLIPADKDAVNRLFSQSPADFTRQVWMMPIETLAGVLVQLTQQREQIKAVIYELTGISDILRGSSDPNETARAQSIKAQFGSLRLNKRQRDVQRFIRDLFRLKAEIFAEHFSSETLAMMTGIQLPSEEDKAAAQYKVQIAQQIQQAGAQIPPEVQQAIPQAQEVLKQPSWEQVMEVMQNDLQRGYRIDIETDSTIEADQAYDQRSLAELYKGIADFTGVMGPMVQQGVLPMGAVKAMLLSAVRKFKMGRQVEDALDEMESKPQNNDTEGQAKAAEAQVKQQEMQLKVQQMQAQAQYDQQKLQMDMQRLQMEAANDRQKLEIDREELDLKRAELVLKRQEIQTVD